MINANICTCAGAGRAEIEALFAALAVDDDIRRRQLGADALDVGSVSRDRQPN
ncbi:MAG: hypothetical protein QGF67_07790 [Lentisphaeria bacterium]|nr:hypothetical protein [Lentisphaeria bacterium]